MIWRNSENNASFSIGTLCGVTVGSYVAATKTHTANAGIPTFLAISSGIAVTGYYVGRAADKNTIEIKVVP